jgi:hypothetical protein
MGNPGAIHPFLKDPVFSSPFALFIPRGTPRMQVTAPERQSRKGGHVTTIAPHVVWLSPMPPRGFQRQMAVPDVPHTFIPRLSVDDRLSIAQSAPTKRA